MRAMFGILAATLATSVAPPATAQVTVRPSNGSWFEPNENWTGLRYYGTLGTFFADVTGDGKADAISIGNYSVTVRRSNGSTFCPVETWSQVPYYGHWDAGAYADVTGEGKADAIVVNVW